MSLHQPLDRRGFLVRTGFAVAAAGLPAGVWAEDTESSRAPAELLDWRAVRWEFALTRRYVHLGGFLLASHPRAVRRAIESHRRRLDANPVHYLHERGPGFEAAVLREAARYLHASPTDIALTDSTTMGLALLFNGIDLRAGQEALTTRHDFPATREALRLKAQRTGASIRTISLYDERSEQITEARLVDRLLSAVRPRTRVLTVTWVHSSTGVKMPVRRIANGLASINAGRAERDRVLLCVDGVHGFGVENVAAADLGCDFFVTGCHKWLFGPRGTGLVWGHPRAWPAAGPTIPSFSGGGTEGAAHTPGGFHSFEHRWALAQGFQFHRRVGRARITARTHALNQRFKRGLAAMRHVHLYTPQSDRLSAGIVCFDVRGLSPETVVERLRGQGIVATATPYTPSYARASPSILNTPAEIDRALAAIRAM
ncbi:MAG: aminotransferase class V-fold PLP-dependent enzyme [Actinomycetota bacterium]|nr:aminotransferase class V-fold PLP-dependent enzyme [Actinomycetota bacterium]